MEDHHMVPNLSPKCRLLRLIHSDEIKSVFKSIKCITFSF